MPLSAASLSNRGNATSGRSSTGLCRGKPHTSSFNSVQAASPQRLIERRPKPDAGHSAHHRPEHAACLPARYGSEPCSGMRPCLGAEQCARARRQGGQQHAIARLHGKGPRCVVLPTMRPAPGTWRRWRGGASAVEDHAPYRGLGPPRCDLHAPLRLDSECHLRPQPRGVACSWPRTADTAAGVRVPGTASAQEAQQAAGAVASADCNPRPPSAPGGAATCRAWTASASYVPPSMLCGVDQMASSCPRRMPQTPRGAWCE